MPNPAHIALANLGERTDLTVVTQNIDDLHERSGCSSVLHLHGEILKVRSEANSFPAIDWIEDLNLGDVDGKGHQLRPHVVWFGESILEWGIAADAAMEADVFIIVGTSLSVFPAAGLVQMAKRAEKFYVDPHPAPTPPTVQVIAKSASVGLPELVTNLLG